MALITYDDKVSLNENPNIPDINKVNASDMNQIKTGVNTNESNIGTLETRLTASTTYSTTETVIGTWLGKPLYRKVVNMGNLPDNYYKDVNHNISNLEEVANIYLRAKTSNDLYYMSNMKGVSTMFGEGTGIVARADATKIQVATNSDYSTHTAYAIIEYTKTTD